MNNKKGVIIMKIFSDCAGFVKDCFGWIILIVLVIAFIWGCCFLFPSKAVSTQVHMDTHYLFDSAVELTKVETVGFYRAGGYKVHGVSYDIAGHTDTVAALIPRQRTSALISQRFPA